jgi:hypothetical protein
MNEILVRKFTRTAIVKSPSRIDSERGSPALD